MIRFQDLRDTNAPRIDEYVAAAERVLRSGRYLNGPETAAFEEELARTAGCSCAVAVSTGLDALRLILRAYMEMGRLTPGDEVIVPANTFIATFLAVTDCGLTAVAADVDEETFCLDMRRLPLSEKTRAVIPVHLYGNPCWDADLFSDLRRRGILVIEDNAQALGGQAAEAGFHGSRSTGSLGDAAAVSFYPAKNIGAFGDAGAVLTSDATLAATVRTLANYGSHERYRHMLRGYNCRIDEVQAALLRLKLDDLEAVNRRRAANAALYDTLVTNPDVVRPRILPGCVQTWHQYVVRHPRRDLLRSALLGKGVETEIHYPVACHLQPCYAGHPGLRVPREGLPVAERLAGEVLSLPVANVSEEEVGTVAALINEF